jgi:hypothetical protein
VGAGDDVGVEVAGGAVGGDVVGGGGAGRGRVGGGAAGMKVSGATAVVVVVGGISVVVVVSTAGADWSSPRSSGRAWFAPDPHPTVIAESASAAARTHTRPPASGTRTRPSLESAGLCAVARA